MKLTKPKKLKKPDTSQQAIELELQYGALNYHPLPVVLSVGKGVWVGDLEGKRYLDFLAGYSALNQGHCHPKIIAALIEQAQKLTLTSRAFHNDLLGIFEKRLCELFGYERLLPMNTGVEAVETAIKLSRKWGYEEKGVAPGAAKIIVCEDNFHGRTIAAISASTSRESRDGFGPFLEGIIKIPFNDLVALKFALEDESVVGFLVEPIQGEAGLLLPERDYLKDASQLCKTAHVLFMADEVQTGLGRTGKLLACDYEEVRPDILILGKALSGGVLPLSAVLANEKIMKCIRPGEHGSTFGGNPLACSVGLAAIDALLDEGMIENSSKLGEVFRRELEGVGPDLVTEVRGMGLMNAIEVLSWGKASAHDICLKLLEKGLLAKPTRQNVIRLTPPLMISESELAQAIEIIRKTFLEI